MVNALENISLKPYNTFGIDQAARYFVEVTSQGDLLKVLKDPKWANISKLVLGGGSNMLLCRDYEGLVLKIGFKGISYKEADDHVLVTAQAGEVWHDLVMQCIDKDLGGMENLALIPGCVGAAPIQNIGAYGVEVKDLITEVHTLHILTGQERVFTNAECRFGYRESVFKSEYRNQYVVCSVTFRLSRHGKVNSSYGVINDVLLSRNITQPTIKDISEAVIHIRSSKLPDPKLIGNAGSFFKNPEVAPEDFERLRSEYPDIPHYATNSSLIKIPAGWLIEKAGWKGKTFGNYGVHANQALVLVNYGGAQGRQIMALASDIQEDIKNKFGIVLHNEVNYIL